MKNKLKLHQCRLGSDLHRIVRIMKITGIIILAALMQVTALVYSQTKLLTLKEKNIPIESALKEIEKQSEFFFFYNNKQIDVTQKIDINVTEKTIGEVLTSVLKGTGIHYLIKDRQIVLYSGDLRSITDLLAESNVTQQQQKTISGTVTDSGGEPLPGVSIVVKGTTQGTVTNADGEYTLTNVSSDATLVFSFVGMKTLEVIVGSKTNINVRMEEETIGIEEVVAVGYGTQKRINITGSVASIDSEKLTVAPVASTTNALSGRLPGLITKQNRGLPGSDNATLSIRGFASPLIIVDGIESSFNNIDASEIESISVLKDASAAIYGSRAGNGVLLITTKRGTISKPKFTLNSTFTLQEPTFFPILCNSGQQTELEREAHLNKGLPEEIAPWTQEEVDLFYAGTNPDFPNEDWYHIAARDYAPQHLHNLTVSGGSEKIKYFGFLGYLDQQSIFKNNGGEYQRYNIRSNIDAKITDRLNIQFDLSTIVEDRDFPWRGDEHANSVWDEYWGSRPYYSGELPDKNKIAYAGLGGAVSLPAITNSEISGYRRTDSQNFKGTLTLDYKFKLEGLSAKAFINYDKDYSFFKMWDWLVDSYSYNYSNDTYTQHTTKSNRGLTYQDRKNRMITGQASLNYDNIIFEDHHITALALVELIDYYSDWIRAFRDGQKTFALD